MSEQPFCGKCGLPIHRAETGLRHFGYYIAHDEDRCLELLHSQLQQAREERDTEVRAFADGVIALITAEQKIMCSSYSIHRYGINKVCNRLKLFVGDLLKDPLPAAGEKEKGGG
jgi:hypothetical protein